PPSSPRTAACGRCTAWSKVRPMPRVPGPARWFSMVGRICNPSGWAGRFTKPSYEKRATMSAPRATLPERSSPAGIRPGFGPGAEPFARRTPSGVVTPRLLVVVRWPVGGIRTHLQHNYPVVAGAGCRFTFVGPADGSLDALRDGLSDLDDAEFVGVPVR